MNLALIPMEGRRTTKLFYLPDVNEPMMQLLRPPALTGNRLFTLGGSNHMVRLDLNTGEIRTHSYTGEMTLYSSAQGEHLLYFLEKKGEDDEKKIEFGRMNPDTFAQTALMEFEDFDSEEGFLAIGLQEKSVATMVKDNGQYHLVVYRQGQSPLIRALKDTSHKLHFGSAAFSPQGNVVYATYHRVEKAKEKGSFGLMEIPLANRPLRRTTLVSEADASETELVLYLQLGLSHDGKTAAVATTYLAADGDNIRPEDCALFLVDLSVPERKVTKVPVPLPKQPKSRDD
jgi:hypothetical protein